MIYMLPLVAAVTSLASITLFLIVSLWLYRRRHHIAEAIEEAERKVALADDVLDSLIPNHERFQPSTAPRYTPMPCLLPEPEHFLPAYVPEPYKVSETMPRSAFYAMTRSIGETTIMTDTVSRSATMMRVLTDPITPSPFQTYRRPSDYYALVSD